MELMASYQPTQVAYIYSQLAHGQNLRIMDDIVSMSFYKSFSLSILNPNFRPFTIS